MFNGVMITTPLVDGERPTAAPGPGEDNQARAMLELTGWAWLVLVVGNGAVALLTSMAGGLWPAGWYVGLVLTFMSLLALPVLLVVGWPVAVLTAWALRTERRESRHVVVFAIVGAAVAALLSMVGRDLGPDTGLLLVAACEGAVALGGGRLLLGVTRRGRVRRLMARPSPVVTAVPA